MSKRRLVITAVLAGQSQPEVARTYGVSQGWISKLMARHRAEGDAAFEPLSRAPRSNPRATPPQTVELVLRLRKQLDESGLDAGADTIGWHLTHHHATVLSRATINRILVRSGAVTPDPSKRPKSSYIRFEADQPNETWQSDFTHYRLVDGTDCEVLTWLDDCTRYALSITAHARVTGPVVLATFRKTVATYGIPASTLTDNGMVFTTRFAGGKGGRNHLEHELRELNITQKNGHPNHPQTQGKVERFQQTLKKWLRAQPEQPATLTQLQTLLDRFVADYNQRRPHRSLPHHATPATIYHSLPKATPSNDRRNDTHNRVRRDKIDKAGSVTLRIAGQLRHIGVGRTHARTDVILLVQDLHVTITNAATGEILRDLIIDPRRDYQPTSRPGPTKK
jgi:transposase InsO family protein